MNTLFDILGATLIGGIILLMIMNLSLYNSQHKYASDYELRLQQNAKTLAEIINYDLRKIGFKHSGNPFIEINPKRISFYSDIDSNGVEDSVAIFLTDSTEVNYTNNPSDKILCRKLNDNIEKGPSLGIKDLRFTYNDYLGNSTAFSDSIKFIKAEIWIETPDKINGKYLFTYWEMTIHPRSL